MASALLRPHTSTALAVVLAVGGIGAWVPSSQAAPAAPTLAGAVWLDASADGLRQSAERPAPGVRVKVQRQVRKGGRLGYVAAASRTTGAKGTWSVAIRRAGRYRVTVVRPAAASAFSPRPAGKVSGAALRSSVSTAGVSRTFTVAGRPGGKLLRVDAGLVPVRPVPLAVDTPAPVPAPSTDGPKPDATQQPAGTTPGPAPTAGTPSQPQPQPKPAAPAEPFPISGVTWNDKNADGIRQDEESKIAGMKVWLYAADRSKVLAVTTTNAFGGWTLTVPPATPYRVKVTSNAPALQGLTRQHVGDDPTRDSDLSRRLDDAYFTDVQPADQVSARLDAGFAPTTEIGDLVWHDTDHDGVQDAGEPGVSGVTVDLYDASQTQLLARTVTDAKGHYLVKGAFSGGSPYRLRVQAPLGAGFTAQDKGGDDSHDSDAIPTSYLGYLTGWTPSFTPSSYETYYEHWDIGLI